VSQKDNLAAPAPQEAWTRPEDYIGAMARKRSFRRARDDKPRTQPERPRLLLSTVPFLALFGLLAVLAAAIMIVAIPGSHPQQSTMQVAQHEKGVAERGWFQEAQKEMQRR